MMQLRIFICLIISLVILCQSSLLFSRADDDEFAEFDDIAPVDDIKKTPGQASLKQSTHLNVPDSHGHQVRQSDGPIISNEQVPESPTVQSSKKSTVPSGKVKVANEKPKLKLVNAPNLWIYRWELYYIEVGFILTFLIYAMNFFYGSNKNSAIIKEWYDESYETLRSNFCLIGGSPLMEIDKKSESEEAIREKLNIQDAYKNRKGFVKMSQSSYTLWCSGRTGMDGVLMQLDLCKRQDLFSMGIGLVKPSHDSITLYYLINNLEGYDNFVFCIANKTNATRLIREMPDINVYCPKRKPLSQCGLDCDRLFVMSEGADINSYILDKKISEFICKHERSINFIHVTDQYSVDKRDEEQPVLKLASPKRMAIFSFNVTKNAKQAAEFIAFSLDFLDRCRKFKLNRDSKIKCEKARQKIVAIQQKTALSLAQQKAKETKDAQRRQEKENMLNETDPAKQRMWERKEAKRELKKNKMRVKQLKVKSM